MHVGRTCRREALEAQQLSAAACWSFKHRQAMHSQRLRPSQADALDLHIPWQHTAGSCCCDSCPQPARQQVRSSSNQQQQRASDAGKQRELRQQRPQRPRPLLRLAAAWLLLWLLACAFAAGCSTDELFQ
jgi:hypothetical protein